MIALARRGARIGRLAGRFLLGQGAIQAVSLAIGLVLVRLLPPDEFALYVFGAGVLALVSLCSNPGVSQALISLGAPREDREALGSLYLAGLQQSRLLFQICLPVIFVIIVVLVSRQSWAWPHAAASLGVILVAAWIRIPTQLVGGLLNARHDASGMFRVGIAEAVPRLALLPLALLWPSALVALSANLVGSIVAQLVATRFARHLVDQPVAPTPDDRQAVRRFVFPLVPVAIYSALQGQLAVLILGLLGRTTMIADIGAVSRLGQIVSIVVMLNPFLFQPMLARRQNRRSYVLLVGMVLGLVVGFSAVVLLSAFITPDLWLMVLGRHYEHLERELPLALSTALITLLGGTLYTAVIARGQTAGQHWTIAPSIAAQLAFAATQGVNTVSDVLVLTLLPTVVYAVVQVILLARLLTYWPRPDGAHR